MALTDIEIVRTGIGDFTTPYILTDEQIQHYLDSNSGDTSATITELQPVILSALASRGSANRIEELWEDDTMKAANYEKAMNASSAQSASKASPIIGGGTTTTIPFKVDQFDPDEWREVNDLP